MVVIQLYWLPYNSIRFYHNICTHIDIILIYVSYRNIPFLYQDPTRQSRNHADGRGRSLARMSKDPKEREIWMWQPCANASETWNAECAHSMCDWEPAVFGWSMRLYECLTASFQDLLSLCQCYSRWSAPLPWNVERPSKRVTEEFPTLCKYCTYVWAGILVPSKFRMLFFAQLAMHCDALRWEDVTTSGLPPVTLRIENPSNCRSAAMLDDAQCYHLKAGFSPQGMENHCSPYMLWRASGQLGWSRMRAQI